MFHVEASRDCPGPSLHPGYLPVARNVVLFSCISTNSSFMGGLVTLDRNFWGYSSILVLHTRPLGKAKEAACLRWPCFLGFGPKIGINGPNRSRESPRMVREQSENGPRMVRDGLRMVRKFVYQLDRFFLLTSEFCESHWKKLLAEL